MAKSKRTVVGDVVAPKEGSLTKSRYIKVNLPPSVESVTLKNGDYIQLETASEQRESAQKALEAGKLSEEVVGKINARLDKRPDFVKAQAILVSYEE